MFSGLFDPTAQRSEVCQSRKRLAISTIRYHWFPLVDADGGAITARGTYPLGNANVHDHGMLNDVMEEKVLTTA